MRCIVAVVYVIVVVILVVVVVVIVFLVVVVVAVAVVVVVVVDIESPSNRQKVVRACGALYILTSECALRHTDVHIFNISAS